MLRMLPNIMPFVANESLDNLWHGTHSNGDTTIIGFLALNREREQMSQDVRHKRDIFDIEMGFRRHELWIDSN